jgi:hypothetical protein
MFGPRPLALLLALLTVGCDRVSLEDDALSCGLLGWPASGTVTALVGNEPFTSQCLRLEGSPDLLRVTATDRLDPRDGRQLVTVEIPAEVGSWDMESSAADGEYTYSRGDRDDRYFHTASGTVEVESVTDAWVRGSFAFVVRNEGGDPARLREGRFRISR